VATIQEEFEDTIGYSESGYRRRTDNTMAKIPKRQSESVYQRRTDNTMDKRYQRGNQNLYIKEEQTTQWSKDTKGVIRICISKNRQHNGQKIPKV
jgi:hypothetical protein